MRKSYRCDHCSSWFESERNDDEARAESTELWGERPEDEMAIICDDCFKQLYAWAEKEGLVRQQSGGQIEEDRRSDEVETE